MLYQQGDILIKSTDNIPEQAEPMARRERGFVLAEGEATGHAHVIRDDVAVLEWENGMFVESAKPFTVYHEEHNPITVPAGKWWIDRVREYDHFAREARAVLD